MARYIDAAILDEAKFEKPSTAFERGWNAAMAAIFKNAPIADVAEVVRCKECKHWERDVIFQDGWCMGRHQPNPNWFCADGERRTDDDRNG